MKKNIGKLIKSRLKSERIGVTEFANLIGKERTTVYDIFSRESIDTNLLDKIGQVLNYDFFQHFINPETIQEIILKKSISNKVYIELDLSEKDVEDLGLKDKIVKIIKK